MVRNGLAGMFSGLQAGRQLGAQDRQRAVTNRLAPQIAQGDYAGAAQAAFQAGDVQTGLQLQQAVRDMARADADQARQEDESFRAFYGDATDMAGRVAGLVRRGVISPDQAPQAFNNLFDNLSTKYRGNEAYGDTLTALRQQVEAAQYNPDLIIPYSEEYAAQAFEAADPARAEKAEQDRRRLALDERRFDQQATEQDRRFELDTEKLQLERDEIAREIETAAAQPAGGKLTEGQRKYAMFARVAESASETINRIEAMEGFDPTTVLPGRLNIARGPEGQAYEAAKEQWIDAIIRPKTGAAVTGFEMRSAKDRYFPRLGDDPATVEAKRRSREAEEQALKAATGGAYEQLFQVNQPAPGAPAENRPPPESVDAADWEYMTPEERALF